MPFKSDSQRKLCYLLKGKGQAGSWDCDEWSTATGKKDLPEHVEDQTEKEASGLSAVKALCALWSIPSPLKEAAARSLLSKLSSVITSPGRGSGDEEETAINPDSSEGLQMAKSTKPVPGRMSLNQKGLKPVAPLGAARNAVRRATESELGFDPASKVKRAFSLFGLGTPPKIPRQQRPKKDWELSDFAEEYPELKGMNFQDLYHQAEQRVLERMAKEQFHGSPESLYAGNKVLSKKADHFDFSSIGTKLDPSLIGGAKQAPSIRGTAPANGFDFSNINKSLASTGKMLGRAATSGVESWVKAPGFSNPGEVWRRRNQALGAQKAIGSATDSAGKAIAGAQRLGSNFLSAGSTLMGMGKQSSIQSTTGGSAIAPKAAVPSAPAAPKAVAPAPVAAPTPAPTPASAANSGGSLGQAWRHRGDIAPVAVNALQAGVGSDDAKARLDADASRFNWSKAKDDWDGWKNKTMANAEDAITKQYTKSLSYGDIAKLGIKYLHPSEYASALTGKGPAYDKIVAGEKTRIKGQYAPYLNAGAQIGSTIANHPFSRWISTGVKNHVTSSEAKRMTAQTAMPYVDWMRANPWAKYVGGGLALGAGAYGLSRMFGGGGQQQEQQPQAGSIFQQSYNQGLIGKDPNYTKTFTPEMRGA